MSAAGGTGYEATAASSTTAALINNNTSQQPFYGLFPVQSRWAGTRQQYRLPLISPSVPQLVFSIHCRPMHLPYMSSNFSYPSTTSFHVLSGQPLGLPPSIAKSIYSFINSVTLIRLQHITIPCFIGCYSALFLLGWCCSLVEREPTTPQSVKDGGDLAWFAVSSWPSRGSCRTSVDVNCANSQLSACPWCRSRQPFDHGGTFALYADQCTTNFGSCAQSWGHCRLMPQRC